MPYYDANLKSRLFVFLYLLIFSLLLKTKILAIFQPERNFHDCYRKEMSVKY